MYEEEGFSSINVRSNDSSSASSASNGGRVIPQQETAVPMRGKQHPVQRAQTAAQEEERWM